MKILLVIIFLTFSAGCDSRREIPDMQETGSSDAEEISSFRMGNAEIRAEMLAELEKNNIQHWINDDMSISYLLSDAEKIDTIGNEIIMAYVSRN